MPTDSRPEPVRQGGEPRRQDHPGRRHPPHQGPERLRRPLRRHGRGPLLRLQRQRPADRHHQEHGVRLRQGARHRVRRAVRHPPRPALRHQPGADRTGPGSASRSTPGSASRPPTPTPVHRRRRGQALLRPQGPGDPHHQITFDGDDVAGRLRPEGPRRDELHRLRVLGLRQGQVHDAPGGVRPHPRHRGLRPLAVQLDRRRAARCPTGRSPTTQVTQAPAPAFAETYSLSLQQTLYRWARGSSTTAPRSTRSASRCPTSTTSWSTWSRSASKNDNEVYFAADRPYGLIEGTVLRDGAEPRIPARPAPDRPAPEPRSAVHRHDSDAAPAHRHRELRRSRPSTRTTPSTPAGHVVVAGNRIESRRRRARPPRAWTDVVRRVDGTGHLRHPRPGQHPPPLLPVDHPRPGHRPQPLRLAGRALPDLGAHRRADGLRGRPGLARR